MLQNGEGFALAEKSQAVSQQAIDL